MTTFARRIGFDGSLESHSKWQVMATDDFFEILSIDDWPGAGAMTQELLWCSEPLRHRDFKRLEEYSVHWQIVNKEMRLWIAREPTVPTNCEHTFNGFDLLYALLSTYKVLITDENSDDHARVLRDFRIDFLKWHVKRLIPTFFLYIGGIVVIAVYHWSKWDGSTEDTIRNFILYAGWIHCSCCRLEACS